MRQVKIIFYSFSHFTGSYDGVVFQSHQNSKNGHSESTMAKWNESPLAVGGWNQESSGWISKAEIFNIATNTWTELADYPYHPE